MVEYACKLGVHYYMMKPYNLDSMLHRIFQTAMLSYGSKSGATNKGKREKHM